MGIHRSPTEVSDSGDSVELLRVDRSGGTRHESTATAKRVAKISSSVCVNRR